MCYVPKYQYKCDSLTKVNSEDCDVPAMHETLSAFESIQQIDSQQSAIQNNIYCFLKILLFFFFLHFPFFLFTVKQRKLTGKTTALSFLDVYTHIHTQGNSIYSC